MAAAKKEKRRRAPDANARTHLPPDERRAKGRAIRDKVRRPLHAGWKPPKGRGDPIEILRASNEGRLLRLVPPSVSGA
jgi:hypothetical protein